MSSNPYSSPLQEAKPMVGQVSNHPMQPLLEAAHWLTFLGWVFLIMGVLYCLTIIGIIIGWLPIWMGILLKDSGAKLKEGFATGSNMALYESSRRLATYFTIMAILTIIGLAINLLYVGIVLLLIISGGLGAAFG